METDSPERRFWSRLTYRKNSGRVPGGSFPARERSLPQHQARDSREDEPGSPQERTVGRGEKRRDEDGREDGQKADPDAEESDGPAEERDQLPSPCLQPPI